MATYLMFGKYSAEGLKKISSKRTKEAAKTIKKLGGKLECAYALLGDKDLVLIVDLPGTEAAMKAAVELTKDTGIAFSTSPAICVDEFDKIAS